VFLHVATHAERKLLKVPFNNGKHDTIVFKCFKYIEVIYIMSITKLMLLSKNSIQMTAYLTKFSHSSTFIS